MAIGNTSQIAFPTKDIHKGKKHRVIVVMHFSGIFCNSDVIGRELTDDEKKKAEKQLKFARSR